MHYDICNSWPEKDQSINELNISMYICFKPAHQLLYLIKLLKCKKIFYCVHVGNWKGEIKPAQTNKKKTTKTGHFHIDNTWAVWTSLDIRCYRKSSISIYQNLVWYSRAFDFYQILWTSSLFNLPWSFVFTLILFFLHFVFKASKSLFQ